MNLDAGMTQKGITGVSVGTGNDNRERWFLFRMAAIGWISLQI